MTIKHQLDQLAKQLLEALPASMRALPKEVEKQFRQILQAAFTKMDLVTHEEFDAQVRVLQRTREKLEVLEKHVSQLHTQGASKTSTKTTRRSATKK